MKESARTKKTAIYIDGYNLYYGRLRGTPCKWLDLPALFDGLMAVQDPASAVQAVKFFTAPALGNFATHGQASVEAQDSYHRALLARHPDRFSITLGSHSMDRDGSLMPSFIPGQKFDRSRQTRVWRIEEKKTDVNIALAMYRDACKGLFDLAVLCSTTVTPSRPSPRCERTFRSSPSAWSLPCGRPPTVQRLGATRARCSTMRTGLGTTFSMRSCPQHNFRRSFRRGKSLCENRSIGNTCSRRRASGDAWADAPRPAL